MTVLLTQHAAAQASGEAASAVLDMITTAEYIDPKERISGGAAVGVSFIGEKDSVDLDQAHVYFARPVTGKIEMQLATVDGRYLATFDRVAKSPRHGWVRLKLSLKKPEFLGEYHVDEVALLMSDALTGTAYPVRWGTPKETGFMRIQINSEGSNAYFVTYDEEEERLTTKNCTPASDRSSFKFDRICDIPIADVIANNEIEIIRKRGAGFGTSIRVKVGYDASDKSGN